MDAETIAIGRGRAARAAGVDEERLKTWARRGLWAGEEPRPYVISEVFSLAACRLLTDFGMSPPDAIAIANRRDPWRLLCSGEVLMTISRDHEGNPFVGPVIDDSIMTVVNLERLLEDVFLKFAAEALDLARGEAAITATRDALTKLHDKISARLDARAGGR